MASDKYIDIEELLSLVSVPFVVIKKSDKYPKYDLGDDIDIYCKEAGEMVGQLLHLSRGFISDGYTVQVKKDGYNIHIDFLAGDILIVRIDVLSSLDTFGDILLSGDTNADLALRLFEYAKHPEKIKHLKFVKIKLS